MNGTWFKISRQYGEMTQVELFRNRQLVAVTLHLVEMKALRFPIGTSRLQAAGDVEVSEGLKTEN